MENPPGKSKLSLATLLHHPHAQRPRRLPR
jgi:hypothetical protein